MLTSIWIWLLWISIHALLAESDRAKTHHAAVHVISIHALLAESDGQDLYYVKAKGISIHALLAESDWKGSAVICPLVYFYPRSPCGERPAPDQRAAHGTSDFYPRSPCGERPWV